MQAIPADHAGQIEVAVSMDANTLSLGYLIKPTLVTVDDRTPASVVITDLLSENGYDWENTGSITNSFYLAGGPDQGQNPTVHLGPCRLRQHG